MRLPESVATFLQNRRIDWQLFWLDVETELRRRHDFHHPENVEEVDILVLRQDPGDPYP